LRERRIMSLTPDLVALCARPEVDPGPDPDWTPLGDEGYAALTDRLLEESGDVPLWIFAYGSLIWKPVFEAVEKRRGTAYGWHRSFCLEIKAWRGSPAQPGLMMALDRGGRCDGVAFRLPEQDRSGQIEAMLRREVSAVEDIGTIRWLPVETTDGPVRALAFWAGPAGRGVARKLPPEEVAWVLARACGHVGSCAEYLYNTVTHLEDHGIRDRNLWRLQHLVADEIRSIARLTP